MGKRKKEYKKALPEGEEGVFHKAELQDEARSVSHQSSKAIMCYFRELVNQLKQNLQIKRNDFNDSSEPERHTPANIHIIRQVMSMRIRTNMSGCLPEEWTPSHAE